LYGIVQSASPTPQTSATFPRKINTSRVINTGLGFESHLRLESLEANILAVRGPRTSCSARLQEKVIISRLVLFSRVNAVQPPKWRVHNDPTCFTRRKIGRSPLHCKARLCSSARHTPAALASALSLLNILYGANAFEINDIQEHGTWPRESGDCDVTLHCTETLPPYQVARDRLTAAIQRADHPSIPRRWLGRGNLLCMAFGITGKYVGTNGKPVEFAAPYTERQAKISSFPDYSIQIILIYAHGAPGLIGDDDVDNLTKMLRKKMRMNGQIHLLGCSTAGIEAHFWNPIGGIGLLIRTIMYHGLPKIMRNDDFASRWSDNLAGDLSRCIPNVYVLGLAGLSFPLSRVTTISEKTDLEGYTPKALMADRFVYYNGKLSKLP
jgi:hypothetical protein